MKTRTRGFDGVALLACVAVAACATWTPSVIPPRQLLDEDPPSAIRVYKGDGSHVDVQDPVIAGDSIVSSPSGTCFTDSNSGRLICTDGATTNPTAVALDEVIAIEVNQLSGGRTAVAIGIPVGLGLLIYAALQGYSDAFGTSIECALNRAC